MYTLSRLEYTSYVLIMLSPNCLEMSVLSLHTRNVTLSCTTTEAGQEVRDDVNEVRDVIVTHCSKVNAGARLCV